MRNFAYFFGVILVFAAVIAAGEMLKSGEPFNPLVPCALAGLGFGAFGFGFFGNFAVEQPGRCHPTDDESSDGSDADGD
jgi:hypothetical protein